MARKRKHYHLRLPAELYEEIGEIAARQGTTRLEVIRKFLLLGLVVDTIESRPDETLYVKRGDELIELRLIV